MYFVDLQEEVILCVFWCRLPMHDLACAFSFSTKCFLLTQDTLNLLFCLCLVTGFVQVTTQWCMSCHSNWKGLLSFVNDTRWFPQYVNSCRLRLPTKCTWCWYSHSSETCNKGRFYSCLTEKQKCSHRLYWWLSKSKGSIPSSDDSQSCSYGNRTINTLARTYYCRSIPELMWGVSNNIEVFQSPNNFYWGVSCMNV